MHRFLVSIWITFALRSITQVSVNEPHPVLHKIPVDVVGQIENHRALDYLLNLLIGKLHFADHDDKVLNSFSKEPVASPIVFHVAAVSCPAGPGHVVLVEVLPRHSPVICLAWLELYPLVR